MNLIDYRAEFRDRLSTDFSVAEIDFYFKQLIKSFFGWEATLIGLQPNRMISSDESNRLEASIKALKINMPLQYIVESAPFMTHSFYVNESVLIPRPETEELVSWVVEDYNKENSYKNVLDIGTGSGCIAISLALSNTFFKVKGIDISEAALEVANKNAKRLEAAVSFDQVNILELGNWKESPLDIIVSNPPYIPPKERKEMKSNVLDFEPKLALFVPEDNPLLFYEVIMKFGIRNLKPGGRLYLEINPNYKAALNSLFLSTDAFQVSFKKDIFGKTRMIRAIKI